MNYFFVTLIIVMSTLIFVLNISRAFANFQESNVLYSDCSTSEEGSVVHYQMEAYCTGYIIGVTDALTDAKIICVPKDVTAGQIREIITKRLNIDPKGEYRTATSVIEDELKVNFSCE